MVQRNSRAERLFAGAKQTDVPNWKIIKDEEDRRRNENTAKLRTARIAHEAAQAAARATAPSVPVRGAQRKSRSKKS